MKHNFKHISSLLTIIVLSVMIMSFDIKGRVIYSYMKNSWLDANVLLLDKQNKIIKRTHTNSRGYYRLKNVKNGTYCIRIYGNNIQTVSFDSIKILKDTFIVLDGFRECEYDKHRKDSICPACHKTDKVVKILYGTPDLKKINSNDSTSYWGDSTVYWGGCVVTPCDPTWYCWRDDKKF